MTDKKYTSENFDGKKFINPVPTILMKPGALWSTMKLWFKNNPGRVPLQKPGPFKADIEKLKNLPTDSMRVTWMGHSTVLIEIDGKRFLTDPVWSKRASPVFFAGPVRFFDPPIRLEDLPKLDGIIISHNHYDHLDRRTIKKLAQLETPFYCPLGVAAYLIKWGVKKERIHEMDWWERADIDTNFALIATPGRHFSGRGITGRDGTQWASWVIYGPQHRVFFGGDSGMFPGFETIGDNYGPFDLTLLEAGAYHPNWGQIHLGPENAIQAHQMLKGKVLMPIHWGTFNLALHGWTEPAEQIIRLAQEKNITILLPVPGACTELQDSSYVSRWWEGSTRILH